MVTKSKAKTGGHKTPDAAVIIGQHPVEEAAAEAGVNLVTALREAGVKAEVVMVPEDVTYLRVMPKLFRQFESGAVSESTLKANLIHNNPVREALLWVKALAESMPGTVFYSMHNFLARYHGRGAVPTVGWGDPDFIGWSDIDKLKVRRYRTEEEAMRFIPELVGRLYGGGTVKSDEAEGMRCHIMAADGPCTYRFQQGDREKLRPVDAGKIQVTAVPVNVIEIPGLMTHFRGQPAPRLTDDDLRDRFMLSTGLYFGGDDAGEALGISRDVRDGRLREALMWFYSMRYGVFDRDINRRAGLTGDYVVKPLAEYIRDDLTERRRLTH